MTLTIYMQGIIVFVALVSGYSLSASAPSWLGSEQPAGASVPTVTPVVEVPKAPRP